MTEKRGVIPKIMDKPVAFASAFILFFALVVVFLSIVDMLPEPVVITPTVQTSNTTVTAENPEDATRIVAKDIGLDVSVVNPVSTDLGVLDEALQSGAVRYPTSAMLGVSGTVLLFGHSSYLPVVYHQYYKTFDGIQNLKPSQVVSVYSAGTEYRYSVVGVRVADANEDVIELPQTGKHLVLVTCDSFSKKTNRFVVTADFVDAYALSSN